MGNKIEQGIKILSGNELVRIEQKREFLIENFINKREVICISAEKKTGKSVLAQQLAFSLSTGKPFLDAFDVAHPCKVLYIQAEGDIIETKQRFLDMMKVVDADLSNIYVLNIRGISLQSEESRDFLEKAAKQVSDTFDVIIFDPLYKMCRGGSMNDDRVAIDWTDNVDILCRHFKATGIVVHHESEKVMFDNKGGVHKKRSRGTLFGNSMWAAYFSGCFKLVKTKVKHFKLESAFERSGEMVEVIDMKMIVPQSDPEGRLFFTIFQEGEDDNEWSYYKLLKNLKEKKKIVCPDIYTSIGIGKSWFYKLRNRLLDQGLISVTKEGNKTYYTWKGEEDAG